MGVAQQNREGVTSLPIPLIVDHSLVVRLLVGRKNSINIFSYKKYIQNDLRGEKVGVLFATSGSTQAAPGA